MNARGDAVAAWVRGARRAAMIVVSVRAAGGGWSEPVAISRRGRPAIDPVATIDGQGGIVVVWRQVVRVRRIATADGPRRQAVYVVRARQRALGSPRWSRVTTLSSSRQKVGAPSAAVDAMGDVIAAWHWGTGTSPADPGFVGQVQYAERPVGEGWTGPRRLSRSPACSEVRRPKVATGTLGDAVIWWQCDLPAGRSTAVAVARPAGKALGPEAQLPIAQRGDVMADLAVAPTGRATAVSAGADGTVQWWRGDVGDTLTLSALAALTTTERIDLDAGPPRIAVSATGDALTAWTDLLGRPRAAPVASRPGRGRPGVPRRRRAGARAGGRRGRRRPPGRRRVVRRRPHRGGPARRDRRLRGPPRRSRAPGWSPRTARRSPATASATPWRSGRGAPRAAPWWSAPSRRVE